MSPTLMPVPPARFPFNARSTILRHVKRAQGRPDAPLTVLAIVCLVVLANSPSSPDPGSRSSFHWFFPRCLRSLGTSNRTGRTTTLSHHNPIPVFPPGDPVLPWPPTYHSAYPYGYDHPRRHSYPPYQPRGRTLRRLNGLNVCGPGPERSVIDKIDTQPFEIPQPQETQSAPSVLAVTHEVGVLILPYDVRADPLQTCTGMLPEAQMVHKVNNVYSVSCGCGSFLLALASRRRRSRSIADTHLDSFETDPLGLSTDAAADLSGGVNSDASTLFRTAAEDSVPLTDDHLSRLFTTFLEGASHSSILQAGTSNLPDETIETQAPSKLTEQDALTGPYDGVNLQQSGPNASTRWDVLPRFHNSFDSQQSGPSGFARH
ncbi:hypothetical protein BKA82DRAFT_31702 [Pisolithus tinctorius]|nr:hypothetical protein BKA82DRAFT_31702 [Pisolithus tinctorius]